MSVHAERLESVARPELLLSRHIMVLVVSLDEKPTVYPVEPRDVEPCEMAYHLLIGGSVHVSHQAETWKILSAERRRLAGAAAANPFANRLVRIVDPSFDDVLCGTVVIVGRNETGEDVDVPAGLLRLARELAAE
jgi:hypothetical protein